MSLKGLLYAYLLGGVTFIPLLILAAISYTIYTSVPVTDGLQEKRDAAKNAGASEDEHVEEEKGDPSSTTSAPQPSDLNDLPKVRKGWLALRRTFEEQPEQASYVGMVRGFLDARSKDPKRSRPKDLWYVALKGKILYLYEDESMSECEAAVELSSHEVVIFPEGLLDGELFARRNAICLKPKVPPPVEMPSVTKEMKLEEENIEEKVEVMSGGAKTKQKERTKLEELEKQREEAREEALDITTPWFIFVKNVVDMEDWYYALLYASEHPAGNSTLEPLKPVFKPEDMLHLVNTLDEQPDVIPMRWLNALIGRVFFSFYRTDVLEKYIIGRLMKKLSKVKRPTFLSDIVVREVSVGNKPPTLSKPMLKELTKEGDAALEIHVHHKGEFRVTVEATATVDLGARFKKYSVKLVLALVLREIEGNMLIKVKRPPSSRIWYAFTQMPRIVLDVEPVVSDRQITWGMILSTIESKVKEVIQESIVLPNMDDISFFESKQYKHRGGIWADATRHRHHVASFSSIPTSKMDERPGPVEAPKSSTSSGTDKPSVPQRSHSAEEPQTEKLATDEGTVPSSPPPSTSGASGSPTRRRTWLAPTADEQIASSSSVTTDEGPVLRGRSTGADSPTTRRSASGPSSSTNASSSADWTPRPYDTEDHGDYLHPSRRSPSRRSHSSSSQDHSAPASSEDDELAPSRPSSVTSVASQRASGLMDPPPNGASSPTAASFFQTLKARAADKQALSNTANTARETMRKWGMNVNMNWSSLKRDSAVGRERDELPDAAEGMEPRTHRARPSYADVRATVEQRRAPEQTLGSDPIPIPGKGKERERSQSPAQADQSGTSAHSASALAPAEADARSLSPSPGLSRVSSRKSDVEDEQPAEPIRTQPPQARTMTIPGIHASHRGEVMSMGYAPPPPPPREEKKAPSMQTVYKLWNSKAQNASGMPGQGGSEGETASAPPTMTSFAPPPPTSESQPTMTTPIAAAMPPTRPNPPPLPPRGSQPLLFKPDVPRRPTGHPLAEPQADAVLSSGADTSAAASPASAALQAVANKDRTKRLSLDAPARAGTSPSPRLNGTGELPEVARSEPAVAADAPPASTPATLPTPRVPPKLPPRRGTNALPPVSSVSSVNSAPS